MGAIVLVLGMVALWVYGNWRERTALLRAQADSLATALARAQDEIVQRTVAQQLLAQQITTWTDRYQVLTTEVTRLRAANAAAVESLTPDLTIIPETTRVRITAVLDGLQRENQLCSSALVVCDSIRAAGVKAIALRDTTIAVQDSLLTVYHDRLAAAVAAIGPSWAVKVGLPVAAILSAGALILLLSH